ncbi:hypothetical protein SteCoe_8803 [Stentor coeruleus]|uniref:Uncharacterized protein n=1 Tax=Stentor coeruleus TaxID=5963 RepID=A0A1R2CJA6_9CILI|nr:hypothetical protein SteCoe_8803 [Stentor coeruleus]
MNTLQNKDKLSASKSKKLRENTLNAKEARIVSNNSKFKAKNISAKSSLINALIIHASSIAIENSESFSGIDLDCSFKKKSSVNVSNNSKTHKLYSSKTNSNITIESKIMDLSQKTEEKKDKISKVKYQMCSSCACVIY